MSPSRPDATAGNVAPDRRRRTSEAGQEFLTTAEAAAVEALTARIMPGDADSPGAREARVANFIDRALNEAPAELGAVYRSGLAGLDSMCHRDHGSSFAALGEALQDQVLREIDGGPAAADLPPGDEKLMRHLGTLFAIVREHTLQGMFCDPEHGGNYGTAGWRLVGFPGAQWGYSPDQMQPGFDSTLISIKTLADLRRERPLASTAEPCSESRDRG